MSLNGIVATGLLVIGTYFGGLYSSCPLDSDKTITTYDALFLILSQHVVDDDIDISDVHLAVIVHVTGHSAARATARTGIFINAVEFFPYIHRLVFSLAARGHVQLAVVMLLHAAEHAGVDGDGPRSGAIHIL